MSNEMTTSTQSNEQTDDRFAEQDWRELRRQERAERRSQRRTGGGAWIGGVALILLGLLFLLQNFGAFYLENWWALFILIPAFAAFATAWNIYRNSGNRFPAAARGSLTTGAILTLVALTFLLGLDFGLIWPFFLILGGLALLLGTLLPE